MSEVMLSLNGKSQVMLCSGNVGVLLAGRLIGYGLSALYDMQQVSTEGSSRERNAVFRRALLRSHGVLHAL